ncbi:MAG: methyltransferase domain-containing protein [FCB group bacterium]
MRTIKRNLRNITYFIHYKIRSIFYSGRKYTCPICKSNFRKFLPSGDGQRKNIKCPGCSSFERHRLLWLYLQEKTDLFTEQKNEKTFPKGSLGTRLKLLDIAPSRALQNRFIKYQNIDYHSADLSSDLARYKFDITNIPLPDESFDCILCSHVLEHIEDDVKAMKELFRVLKQDGWVIFQVPVDNKLDATIEEIPLNLPLTKGEKISKADLEMQRLKLFGQKDHVRIYGKDFGNRLREAGFNVVEDDFAKGLSNDIIDTYRLNIDEILYYCTKKTL